jgi:hypothetical protein
VSGTFWQTTQPVSQATASNLNADVVGVGNSTYSAGQTAVTATAAALGSNSTKQVCIEALSTNSISVFIGGSGVTTSTGFELKAGAGKCMPLTNTNQIYVVASTTGATVTWDYTN